jgi:ribosomal protein S18 acetylase RimI-like enzyme
MDSAIRSARSDEYAMLADIERGAAQRFAAIGMSEIAAGAPAPEAFLRAFATSGAALVAAERARDQLVGFILVGFLDCAAHIYELSVLEPHGRRGLGRRLIEEACRFARAKATRAVTLSTFRDVAWNGPFYERMGFAFLPRYQWTPSLHLLRDLEQRIGLPVERRGFMSRHVR